MNGDVASLSNGLFLLNLLVSLHILAMVLIIVKTTRKGRSPSGSHVMAAKVTFSLFAVLGVWTVLSRWFMEIDGETTDMVVTFVSFSLRVAIAILVTAWAWDNLEGHREDDTGR